MSQPLLQVDKLTLRFGGLTAVSEVDLQVREGEVAAVIGPNGAGKTSLFNAITGIYEPTEGQVALDEFIGADGQPTVKAGDEIEVAVQCRSPTARARQFVPINLPLQQWHGDLAGEFFLAR